MPTEITPSGLSLSLDQEFGGRPIDGYYNQSNPSTAGKLYHYGKRMMSFDGKVYKYGHTKGACYGGFGAFNVFPVSKHLTYAVLPIAIKAGDLFTTLTYPSSAGYASTGFAKDELVGGYIVVGHTSLQLAETHFIAGNDAISATTSTVKIKVADKFGSAHTVSDGAEAYPNPYGYLISGPSVGYSYQSVMGVPIMSMTSGYDGWFQTWGPCWLNPGSADTTMGEGASNREVFFVADGSVNSGLTIAIESGYQHAGFQIDTTSSGVTSMPLVMLQISI
jgi:hypothetical protein